MSNNPLVIEANDVRMIEIKRRKIVVDGNKRFVSRDIVLRDEHDNVIFTVITYHEVGMIHQVPMEADTLLTMIR